MVRTVSSQEFQARATALLDDVGDRRAHVVVTRDGRPAAALVPIDEYEELEESAQVLADPAAISAIAAGMTQLDAGDGVTLDELRAEARRPGTPGAGRVSSVLVARRARLELLALEPAVAAATLEALGLLEHRPHAGRALRGRLTGLRALRVDALRVVYVLSGDAGVAHVLAVRPR